MKRTLCIIYNQHDYKSIYRLCSKMEQIILSTIATLNMLYYRSEAASISRATFRNWSVSCVWACTITPSRCIGNHLKEDINRSQTQ